MMEFLVITAVFIPFSALVMNAFAGDADDDFDLMELSYWEEEIAKNRLNLSELQNKYIDEMNTNDIDSNATPVFSDSFSNVRIKNRQFLIQKWKQQEFLRQNKALDSVVSNIDVFISSIPLPTVKDEDLS